MKELIIKTKKPYSIFFHPVDIKKWTDYEKAHIITDSNIAKIYSLPKTSRIHIMPKGEENKNFGIFEGLCREILSQGIAREDTIIAIGGGVVGDMAGFVASVILRGVALIQIPTTLLAMTDSSVGGKCGINTALGKNLIGSFHQPKEVHIDTGFLNTLPERVKRDGMGEVVKYNMIGNISLDSPIEEIIYNCVRLKGEIVAEDEKDRGIRKILNYGHTIGHAIEKLTDYSVYTHGEAVAMGMFAAACVGEKLGFPSYIREYLKETLINYSLPWKMPDTDSHVLEDLISHDKKMSAGKIDMVVLEDIGRPIICPLTPKEIVLCLK